MLGFARLTPTYGYHQHAECPVPRLSAFAPSSPAIAGLAGVRVDGERPRVLFWRAFASVPVRAKRSVGRGFSEPFHKTLAGAYRSVVDQRLCGTFGFLSSISSRAEGGGTGIFRTNRPARITSIDRNLERRITRKVVLRHLESDPRKPARDGGQPAPSSSGPMGRKLPPTTR